MPSLMEKTEDFRILVKSKVNFAIYIVRGWIPEWKCSQSFRGRVMTKGFITDVAALDEVVEKSLDLDTAPSESFF